MDALATWLVELAFPFIDQCAPVGVVGVVIALGLVRKRLMDEHKANEKEIEVLTTRVTNLEAEAKRAKQETEDLLGRLDRRDVDVDRRFDEVRDGRIERLLTMAQVGGFSQPAQKSNDTAFPTNQVVINNNHEAYLQQQEAPEFPGDGKPRRREPPGGSRARANNNDEERN